jgi:DNA-binding transcriptional LysR family regulator
METPSSSRGERPAGETWSGVVLRIIETFQSYGLVFFACMSDVSLESLKTLVAVVRAGSQREGAKTRGLSVPTVSQQLTSLEAKLGMPLFERVGRRALPTPEARRLVGALAPAFDAIVDALDAAIGAHRGVAGPVAIGAPRPFGAHWLTPRMNELLRVRPGLVLTLRYGGPSELESRLLEGTLDLAILVREPSRDGVVAQRLHEEQLVAVADRPLRAETSQDALAWSWLAFDEDRPLLERWWRGTFGGRARMPEPRGFAADLPALRALASAGHGVVVLPDYFVADDLAAGRLHAVRLARARRVRNVLYVAWRKGSIASPRRTAVLDAIVGRVGHVDEYGAAPRGHR